MERTEAMREPRVLCTLISEVSETKLSDPPQPLELASIDKVTDQLTLFGIGL